MSWFRSWSRTQRHAEDVTALQDEAARIRREWSTPSTPQPASVSLVGTPSPGGVVTLPGGVSPQSVVMSIGGTGSLLVSRQAALSQAQQQAMLNQQMLNVQQQYALSQGIQQANQYPFVATRPDGWYENYQREYDHHMAERRRAEHERLWNQWLQKHKPAVRARLQKLNPFPPEPGSMPRGFRQKLHGDIFFLDLVPAQRYLEKWGNWPNKIARKRGRKTWVTRCDYVAGSAHSDAPCPNAACCSYAGHAGQCEHSPF